MEYTQGAHQIVRGVETAVEGRTVGETKHVIVAPADGYGVRDLTALRELPKQKVPEDISVGMRLRGKDPNSCIVQPIEKAIKDHTVLLDFNHPFAGKTLYFDVKIINVHCDSGGNCEKSLPHSVDISG
ncbi:MAG: FKBP-type peptidyl-prolyl cis-trans isomerase [Nitrospiraceae bacterium]